MLKRGRVGSGRVGFVLVQRSCMTRCFPIRRSKRYDIALMSSSWWLLNCSSDQLLFKRISITKLHVLQPLLSDKTTSDTIRSTLMIDNSKTVHVNEASFVIRTLYTKTPIDLVFFFCVMVAICQLIFVQIADIRCDIFSTLLTEPQTYNGSNFSGPCTSGH